jgi:hypothetical protein
MTDKYILNRLGEPVLEPDLLKWARWFETAERHVAEDTISGVRVSTVVLGLDHAHGGGPPVLYETMIFCDDESWAKDLNEFQRRYSTLVEAKAGHAEAVSKITHKLN